MDHFLLKLGNLAKLPAGGDNQLELVGRVDRSTAHFARSEQAQHEATRLPHEIEERFGNGQEDVHRRSHGEGDPFRLLQSQGLRDQFSQDHVQVSDQGEGQNDADAVRVDGRMRHAA